MFIISHRIKWARTLTFGLLLLFANRLIAQNADKDNPEKKLPAVENLTLETKDGVFLSAKFFPGTKGKEAVPIIMLHSMMNTAAKGAVYSRLAQDIQKFMGHAVIVPDLRGHGDSTKRRNPADVNDRLTIDRDTFTKDEFASVGADIEACKKYLMTKNNKGELNIEKLCVIASDISAIVAINWAVYDWSQPSNILIKNGQDVKALILLTPMQSHRGLSAQQGRENNVIKRQLSILILAGQKGTKYYADSKRIHNQLVRFHPDKFENEMDERNNKKLFEYGLPTSSQGSSMLNIPNLKPNPSALIGNFILYRLEKQEGFTWQNRDPDAE